MAITSNATTKVLIELSTTVEDADNVVIWHLEGSPTFKEKIAFLKGMFDCAEIIDGHPDDSDELVYSLLLHSIISEKYL